MAQWSVSAPQLQHAENRRSETCWHASVRAYPHLSMQKLVFGHVSGVILSNLLNAVQVGTHPYGPLNLKKAHCYTGQIMRNNFARHCMMFYSGRFTCRTWDCAASHPVWKQR